MANLTTSADIIDYALFGCNEPMDSTSDFYSQAIIELNRAYRAIWMGGGEFVPNMNEQWLWLKKDPPGVLTLEPIIETGTVNVINNNTGITFSGAQAKDLDGWFFKVSNHPDVFRIAAHTAGSASATLDGPYTGVNNTAASYRLSKLEYELASDVLRVFSPMRVRSTEYIIDGRDLDALERDSPLAVVEAGVPTLFAPVTETKVRFNKAAGTTTTDLIRVEYDYLQAPTALADDSNTPLIPLHYRQVLADLTLFYLLTHKTDSKAEEVGLRAKAGLAAMAADNRSRLRNFSHSFGAIVQRPTKVRRATRWLRTESGLLLGG